MYEKRESAVCVPVHGRAFAAQFDLPIINVEQLTAFRRAIPALQGPLAEATVPAIDDLAKIADGGAVTRPFALPKDSAVQVCMDGWMAGWLGRRGRGARGAGHGRQKMIVNHYLFHSKAPPTPTSPADTAKRPIGPRTPPPSSIS